MIEHFILSIRLYGKFDLQSLKTPVWKYYAIQLKVFLQ